jgi:hypothetical protein
MALRVVSIFTTNIASNSRFASKISNPSNNIFTPQVARMIPPRPVTADNVECDRVLELRIALLRWIEPEHLHIPDGHGREGFLVFAQQGSSYSLAL